MYKFNIIPVFENEHCTEKRIAIIPAHVMAKIIRYNLEHCGISAACQRNMNIPNTFTIKDGMMHQSADDRNIAIKEGMENYKPRKFEAGEGSLIVSVPNSMLDNSGSVTFMVDGYSKVFNGVIMMPETDEELAQMAKDIAIIDGQTHTFVFDPKVFEASSEKEESIRTSVAYVCHILVDATRTEQNEAFLRNNRNRYRVSTTLQEAHAIDNNARGFAADFARNVIVRLANDKFNISDDYGVCYSDINGNVDIGYGQAKYKLHKLIQALADCHLSLYRVYGGDGKKALSTEVEETAASDLARLLVAWNITNAAHYGTNSIFGKLGFVPQSYAKTKREEKVINIAPILNHTDGRRGGGEAAYNVHYIFATAPAIIEYLRYEKKTIGNMRPVIEKLYQMRGMRRVEDRSLKGGGGGDAFNLANRDIDVLVSMANNHVSVNYNKEGMVRA